MLILQVKKSYKFYVTWTCHTAAAAAKSLQSCPTLCNPIDGSPPGSPVPGILQARTLEWVAISFSKAWKWKVKVKCSVVSNSSQPHGLQPTRLLCPWDFPGKSTGGGCHRLLPHRAEFGVESKMYESKFQPSPVPVPSFPEFLSILVTLWISTSQSNIFQNLVELNSHCSYNQRKRKKNFFGRHCAKQNEEVLYFRASQSLE